MRLGIDANGIHSGGHAGDFFTRHVSGDHCYYIDHTPIVLPALMQFEVNLVWYGILLMINLELALITPPVGMNLFVIKGIAKAPLSEVIKGALPYVGLMIIGLVIVLLFKPIALWLPQLAGFGI